MGVWSLTSYYQNGFSEQLRELQAKGGSTKAYAKVFVKGTPSRAAGFNDADSFLVPGSLVTVLKVKNLAVPIPEQRTMAMCKLNNGIHFVTTPEYRLGQECQIEQEFEL